ncbi:MAG: hypothetical protein IT158_21675 [Bryobacterales bacterium]|nr:hypothetical protein [Bryobacterales bacterium]
MGDLLRGLIAKAAPEPPPYRMEAPAALIANLSIKDNTRILHMANWTGNKLERAGANEYYLSPVENVRVRLALPQGKRVSKVELLAPGASRKELKASSLEVLIPRIRTYQALRVDLE